VGEDFTLGGHSLVTHVGFLNLVENGYFFDAVGAGGAQLWGVAGRLISACHAARRVMREIGESRLTNCSARLQGMLEWTSLLALV